MHLAFDIAWNLALCLIVIIYPLVAVFRGRRFFKTIAVAWIVAVMFTTFLSMGLPLTVRVFSRPLAKELETHWVPEGPFIVAVALFVGWVYPLVAASLGYGGKQLWRRFRERQ